MTKEKDKLRALELAGAARDLAGALRGLVEAQGGAQKSMVQAELRTALIKWQMTCEGRCKERFDSLLEFAKDFGLSTQQL